MDNPDLFLCTEDPVHMFDENQSALLKAMVLNKGAGAGINASMELVLQQNPHFTCNFPHGNGSACLQLDAWRRHNLAFALKCNAIEYGLELARIRTRPKVVVGALKEEEIRWLHTVKQVYVSAFTARKCTQAGALKAVSLSAESLRTLFATDPEFEAYVCKQRYIYETLKTRLEFGVLRADDLTPPEPLTLWQPTCEPTTQISGSHMYALRKMMQSLGMDMAVVR